MSLLLLALLLFLLFGGSRISAAGKGLGEAVRHVKRAASQGDPHLPPPAPPSHDPPDVVQKEPKLLPAKGESSAGSGERNE